MKIHANPDQKRMRFRLSRERYLLGEQLKVLFKDDRDHRLIGGTFEPAKIVMILKEHLDASILQRSSYNRAP